MQLGLKVRQAQQRGEDVPAELMAKFERGRRGALPERPQHLRRPHPPVRHRRRADRAGDPRVLLRLRRAGDGGLRDDRDVDRRHRPDARGLPLRLDRQAAAGRRDQDRRRRRDPAPRRQHLPGLLQERGGLERRRSRAAGCTRATSAGSTRTASSTSRAARRTSSSPPAARTSRRRTSRTGSSRTSTSRSASWWATAAPTWSRW